MIDPIITSAVDDNTTTIALSVISLLGVIVTGVFSFLSLRFSAQAVHSSQANAEKLESVGKAVDGMTQARVDVETRLGEANVNTARAEGRAEGQSTERDRPPDQKQNGTPGVDQVEVVKAIPLTIKGKQP